MVDSVLRSKVKTVRAIKRLFTELPQPARTFSWCFVGFFFGTFLLLAVTRVNWFFLGMIGAGVSLFLFGLHVFRDINNTASVWSTIYKESRGIRPSGFTFADVPTIRGMGFMYMVAGLFFIVGSGSAVFLRN
ncbi:hypothetical protein OUO20_05770 [Arthrobacter sp. FX8]|uniref:hypothetical protein n=1 Tax=Arthrobacter sp. FX8 TaxID=2997335 RepID=UPI00227A58A8|nr:hypothetical protein [Arthrobacter sp. FX8]WAJ34440.1 hypothetical protein OUO20_05770 [Arthrobacter sp. FX8]